MGVSNAAPSAPPDDSDLPSPGEVVAERYRIDRVLARGGMGVVFEGEHLGLARPVAVKFLRCEAEDAAARFLREARAAARLESEHVVRVLDLGTHREVPFIAMELLVGVDLHAYLAARGPLPVGEAVGTMLQACEGLAEAHAKGIVHRDLKPSNLFLARRADGSSIVKLLDFGVAKAPAYEPWSQGNLTSALLMLGSPPYMSPEHLRDAGGVDARTDLWSLGVILYELVTGRHPFEGSTPMQLGARIALEAPAPLRERLPDAPPALEAIVARCLEKDPAARFQTVMELASALAPLALADAPARAALARIERASSNIAGATVAAVAQTAAEALPSSQASASRPASAPIPATGAASGVVAVSSCDRFRRQHEELQRLGMEIAGKLSRKTIVAEAADVRRLVARFAGKLAVHASMENEALYPRLLAHADAAVRARARSLYDEVGGLYSTFHAYTARWPTVASIHADPHAFVTETRELLTRLAFRMVRENDELYPLVDTADHRA
jgi:serine/threonine-protein kinase